MTYATIATMAQNTALAQRMTASAAEEKKTRPYPEWVQEYAWDLASTPGWALAWESAVASGVPDPGSDPTVITDQMILSAVQPMGVPPVPPILVEPGSVHEGVAHTNLAVRANPTSAWEQDEYATFSDGDYRWDGDSWGIYPPPAPNITELAPSSASIMDEDFEGHILGTGFTEDTVIIWNGAEEPTRFVSENDVWTMVVPSVVTAPTVLNVYVRNGDGQVSNIEEFTWEA